MGGNTLDKKGSHRPQGNHQGESSESREVGQREMLGQGTVMDIGLPMLQEARN